MFEQAPNVGPSTLQQGAMSTHTFEIILMLLLAWLLGWWLSRLLSQRASLKLTAELEAERRHRRTLEGDFDRLRGEHSAYSTRVAGLEGDLMRMKTDLAERSVPEPVKIDPEATAALKNALSQSTHLQSELAERSAKLAECSANLAAALAGRQDAEAQLVALREHTPKPVAAPSKPDDLKKIEGIGPKIEQLMHAAGIHTFAELAGTETDRLKAILLAAGERFRVHDPSSWPKQAGLCAAERWEELDALQKTLVAGRG